MEIDAPFFPYLTFFFFFIDWTGFSLNIWDMFNMWKKFTKNCVINFFFSYYNLVAASRQPSRTARIQVGITYLTRVTWSNNQGVQNNIYNHLLRLLGNLLIGSVHLSEAALSILARCLVITVTVGSQYVKLRHSNAL